MRACHFVECIDDSISHPDQECWDMIRREEEGQREAYHAEMLRLHNEALKKELDDIRKERP